MSAMKRRPCRVCGNLAGDHVSIFDIDGLKEKVEACLPIALSQNCVLQNKICTPCMDSIERHHLFVEKCIKNIKLLEAHYNVQETCLKPKYSPKQTNCKGIQTEEDFSDLFFLKERNKSFYEKIGEVEKLLSNDDIDFSKFTVDPPNQLVGYDVESDDASDLDDDDSNKGKVELPTRRNKGPYTTYSKGFNTFEDGPKSPQYYKSSLISEITIRKSFKRKSEVVLIPPAKFRKTTLNKRKGRVPMKVEKVNYSLYDTESDAYCYVPNDSQNIAIKEENTLSAEALTGLPQICLLCEGRFGSYDEFVGHMMDIHGIDMQQILGSEVLDEKKKKLPDLLKITDMKPKEVTDDTSYQQMESESDTAIQEASHTEPEQSIIACPLCPLVFNSRSEIFTHLRIAHERQSSLICGLCLAISPSYMLLTAHLESCKQTHEVKGKYICKICSYADENMKLVENHILVHDFVLGLCKKQSKIFDPTDYIQITHEGMSKVYNCSECESVFNTFKEFSSHRRVEHQIFHCDLCNKFYGRNSHLWKHVNRLHKGHPSITCQLCYKTSASKYHLSQHFNKIHNTKSNKAQNVTLKKEEESFLTQKFEGFDFQSVKQSFMKQQLLEDERNKGENGTRDSSDGEDNYDDNSDDKTENPAGAFNSHLSMMHGDIKKENSDDNIDPSGPLPKEIDSTSNLYTNIITNYTPPQNEGEYKCPKCFKGFHKKPLLKKHKKNCRPKLQKDLLTRCKTCSRIFKDRQSLAKHLVNYHSEYTCEICEQKVQSKCEIVSHIRFSHPLCHLKCHCGNFLRNTADLREHKADHRNSFVCQFCGDALPTKIKLKMHILSLHRKILSLSCGICLRLFETQHILRDHVRIAHGNELSQFTSCSVCGKNYGSKWKTYDHINKSHGKTFKACKSCLEVFDTDAELQVHCDSVHFNEPRSVPRGPSDVATSSMPKKELEENGKIKQELTDSDYDENSSDQSIPEDDIPEANEKDTTQSSDVFDRLPVKAEGDYKHSVQNNNEILPNNLVDNKISLLERRLLGKPEDPMSEMLKNPMGSVPFDETTAKLNKSKSTSKVPKSKSKIPKNYDGDDSAMHNTSKRTVYVNSNDPSLCEICLRTWPAKKHLWQHYIRCHKTVAATVCGICLKTNNTYDDLQKHLKDTHPTLLHGQGFGSNFICRICGRYHNASSKLRLHMAIHENFDPAILEKYSTYQASPNTNGNQKFIGNGFPSRPFALGQNSSANDDINYESMIEQVETSDDDTDDSDGEGEDGDVTIRGDETVKEESDETAGNGENSTSSAEESAQDSSMSDGNSVESQMLQDMLKKKRKLLTEGEEEEKDDEMGDDEKDDYSSSGDEDDSSYSSSSMSDVGASNAKSEYSSEDEGTSQVSMASFNANSYHIYEDKSKEIDSAVRSIAFEKMSVIEDQIDDDYCDIPTQNLNPHEIQSAVDSIL